ncbi:hypothetical protein FZ983_11240 [Azospirillum sp. B21]|uniref:hypothetical protein n=1 Tax=Azospirillum sp. B21 TaxID=2607496 RepID=UPI0011EEFFE8|nr:hypothetical protein [Azospirillum sp. B21]KAA0580169.1 hypothetical protein FZ983_11240 [Azospirillum sp. B21]
MDTIPAGPFTGGTTLLVRTISDLKPLSSDILVSSILSLSSTLDLSFFHQADIHPSRPERGQLTSGISVSSAGNDWNFEGPASAPSGFRMESSQGQKGNFRIS